MTDFLAITTVLSDYLGFLLAGFSLLLVVLLAVYWRMANAEQLEGYESVELLPPTAAEKKRPAPEPVATVKEALPAAAASLPAAAAPTFQAPGGQSLTAAAAALQEMRAAARQKIIPEEVRRAIDNVFEAGKIALSEGRWEAAKQYFEEALKLLPEDPDLYVKLAAVSYELGDLAAAESFCMEGCRRHPLAARAFRKHLAVRV